MEASSGWIGEHVQGIKLGTKGVYFGSIGALVTPLALPFLFDFPKVVLRHGFIFGCLLSIILQK